NRRPRSCKVCAASISRSRRASPRRSTGRRRSRRSARRSSSPPWSSRRSGRCSSTTRICSRFATPRSPSSSKRRAVPHADRAIVRHVVPFGRVLREGGLEIGPGRIADALRGLDHVDLTLRDDVYWTLRSNFVTRHDELAVFDRAFRTWFLRSELRALELP